MLIFMLWIPSEEAGVGAKLNAKLTVSMNTGNRLLQAAGVAKLDLVICPPRRLYRLAAVNDHGVADHERGRVGTQPENSRGDLLAHSHPADWLLCDHPLLSLASAAGEALHHWGGYDPRAHGIYPDLRMRVVEGS